MDAATTLHNLLFLAKALHIERPLVVFDLETTGVFVEQDRIVELGAVKVSPDGTFASFTRLLNPDMPIPAEATAVHHIADADVKGAPRFWQIAEEFRTFLGDADLVGYNLKAFDLRMLQAEYIRAGLRLSMDGRHVIDALAIFRRQEERTLAAAVQFYVGEEFAAHRALNDVEATVAVLAAQFARYELPATVADLEAYCFPRDPSWVDAEGKFVWRNNEVVLAFGKNQGQQLRMLAKTDPSFLRWMIGKDFQADTKRIAGDALKGVFPVRAAS